MIKKSSILNERQLSLIRRITKYTLLSSISIFLGIILVINIWIFAFFPNNIVYGILFELNVAITFIGVMFCMYLSFKISSNYYNYICIKCDNKLQNICQLLTQKKVEKTQKEKFTEMSTADCYHKF